MGAHGPSGPKGCKGEHGNVGAQGPSGRPGSKGDHGNVGAQGPPGRMGAKGDHGDVGAQGPSGQPGSKGDQGNVGAQGPSGPKGSRGDRGYEGFRGRSGPKGAKGEYGYRGSKGAKGQRGSTGYRGPPGPTGGGVVYTRWGSHSCPSTSGTRLLYTGRVGGSHYEDKGGGSNHLCMPPNPDYNLRYKSRVQGYSYVYGSEYEKAFAANTNDNVPCAVCSVSSRSQLLMIPAKTRCPTFWTREYYGYLMSEYRLNYRSSFICVDRNQETVRGSAGHVLATDLYHVEAHCSGMDCPPYREYKELTCVVCTN